MVSFAQESRAANPWSSPRGDSNRSRRTDVGACSGCARRASRAVHHRRPATVSDNPRSTVPNTGTEPPQNHEESTIQEETAAPLGRLGAAVSGNAGFLAQFRLIAKNWH